MFTAVLNRILIPVIGTEPPRLNMCAAAVSRCFRFIREELMVNFLTKIFGSRNDRLIRQYRRKVAVINKLEPEMKALTDEQLKAKTVEFRQRLADGATLDSLLPEAFAVVREASFRVLGMRHFDVQLIGGMVLNDNKIAEMRRSEEHTSELQSQ